MMRKGNINPFCSHSLPSSSVQKTLDSLQIPLLLWNKYTSAGLGICEAASQVFLCRV